MKSNHVYPPLILRQGGFASIETQLVNQFAMIEDVPVLTSALDRLEDHVELLASGEALPVGSVEFVRRAMALACIEEPANLTYPEPLQRFLLRDVKVQRAGAVLGTHFVKPTKTKTFTGFVFDTMTDPASLSPHDREQYDAFMLLDADELVWVSEPVRWQAEVRYYIAHHAVLGMGRYDDGQDHWALPDERVVEEMVDVLARLPKTPAGYTLDVGMLDTGETALVECNDAWAIGYYKGTLSRNDYIKMLWARWSQLTTENRNTPPCTLSTPFRI